MEILFSNISNTHPPLPQHITSIPIDTPHVQHLPPPRITRCISMTSSPYPYSHLESFLSHSIPINISPSPSPSTASPPPIASLPVRHPFLHSRRRHPVSIQDVYRHTAAVARVRYRRSLSLAAALRRVPHPSPSSSTGFPTPSLPPYPHAVVSLPLPLSGWEHRRHDMARWLQGQGYDDATEINNDGQLSPLVPSMALLRLLGQRLLDVMVKRIQHDIGAFPCLPGSLAAPSSIGWVRRSYQWYIKAACFRLRSAYLRRCLPSLWLRIIRVAVYIAQCHLTRISQLSSSSSSNSKCNMLAMNDKTIQLKNKSSFGLQMAAFLAYLFLKHRGIDMNKRQLNADKIRMLSGETAMVMMASTLTRTPEWQDNCYVGQNDIELENNTNPSLTQGQEYTRHPYPIPISMESAIQETGEKSVIYSRSGKRVVRAYQNLRRRIVYEHIIKVWLCALWQ